MKNKFLKLTDAAYKVLESFPESDPLKHRAKDRVLAIMDNLVLMAKKSEECLGWATLAETFKEEKTKAQISEDIDILLGYLWIGKSQGWLNQTNCLIISNEYEKIKKEMGLAKIERTQELPGIGKPDEPLVTPMDEQALAKPTERQIKIIDFLNKNGKGQVMDFQTVLPDVTKRTIRRDLDELLSARKIIREGNFNEVVYKLAVS